MQADAPRSRVYIFFYDQISSNLCGANFNKFLAKISQSLTHSIKLGPSFILFKCLSSNLYILQYYAITRIVITKSSQRHQQNFYLILLFDHIYRLFHIHTLMYSIEQLLKKRMLIFSKRKGASDLFIYISPKVACIDFYSFA